MLCCGRQWPPTWGVTVAVRGCTPESDLRIFLRWCSDQDLDPLAAVRVDIERYVRWLQDVRRYQPSTVSRRLSIVVGFYRVCVIDQILPHSPADYVRRPVVPPESPTLGLGHLQFEALITAARLSDNPNDFALVPYFAHGVEWPVAMASGVGWDRRGGG
jgi:hypothetical protein